MVVFSSKTSSKTVNLVALSNTAGEMTDTDEPAVNKTEAWEAREMSDAALTRIVSDTTEMFVANMPTFFDVTDTSCESMFSKPVRR